MWLSAPGNFKKRESLQSRSQALAQHVRERISWRKVVWWLTGRLLEQFRRAET